jgi:hypothetical protein
LSGPTLGVGELGGRPECRDERGAKLIASAAKTRSGKKCNANKVRLGSVTTRQHF